MRDGEMAGNLAVVRDRKTADRMDREKDGNLVVMRVRKTAGRKAGYSAVGRVV